MGFVFPSAQVVHSDAPSSNARAPGGVAIIVPPCYEILEHQEVIQGYCLALTLKDITKNVVFICMVAYLRPGMPMDILKELQDKYPAPDISLFFLGDLKFDYVSPRDQDEEDLLAMTQ